MSVRSRFTEADLAAVREATAAAERASGVEIVAVVVERCDGYEEAAWRAAAFGALAGAVLAAIVRLTADVWSASTAFWILLPPLAGAVTGFVLASWLPTLRRLLVPDEVLERRAASRASQAFLDEEAFATADRTGLVVLVALFERRAVVVADRGIDRRVPEGSWNEVVARLAAGIRAGRPGPALVEAIAACGRLAAEHGVARRPDDRDELADGVRFPDG